MIISTLNESMNSLTSNITNMTIIILPGEGQKQPHLSTSIQLTEYQPGITGKSVLLIISLIALFANILVCAAILSVPNLRREIVNCFVLSLCSTQILVDVVVMPLFCFAADHFIYSYAVALTVMAYITSLLALTLDRYLAVSFPLRYRGLMWYSRCVRLILACWSISAIIQLLPILWKGSTYSAIIHKIYLAVIAITFLFIPLILVMYAYAAILLEVISLSKRDKKRGFKKKNVREKRKVSESLTEYTDITPTLYRHYRTF